MKVGVVGTGYVGLVTGVCLAESGNDVVCMDSDASKVAQLSQGKCTIYEPGLEELLERNLADERLRFTTKIEDVAGAQLIFLAVGTPSAEDGSADLSSLMSVVESLGKHLGSESIVVIKSTVPVGTNAKVAARLQEICGGPRHVASNPEFLKEGAALEDFMKPDRVVVGARSAEVAAVMKDLYAPFLRTEKPLLTMSPESAEMTKYVANAMLATKISFINEVAGLCEHMEADINDVRRGIGHDSRIGFAFLFPGAGYGGSCFPKDVRALQAMARSYNVEPEILTATDKVNERQKTVLFRKIQSYFGKDLPGKTIAIWGLSFKPQTDDIREAPALALIDRLLEAGAKLQVHDPEAMENVRKQYGDRLQYAEQPYAALEGADALAIVTEWKQFLRPDFARMRQLLKSPVIFDGRNVYEPKAMADAGFHYHSIGRAVSGKKPT